MLAGVLFFYAVYEVGTQITKLLVCPRLDLLCLLRSLGLNPPPPRLGVEPGRFQHAGDVADISEVADYDRHSSTLVAAGPVHALTLYRALSSHSPPPRSLIFIEFCLLQRVSTEGDATYRLGQEKKKGC